MPTIGQIAKGKEVGLSGPSNHFIWAACGNCGKERWVKAIRGSPVPRLCRTCSNSQKMIGVNNPGWKGGSFEDSQGYILTQAQKHPRSNKKGYVLEHILIWEKTHSTPLPEGWVIHHLNGIKNDNRPRNLFAMPKRGHTQALHFDALKQHVRELEAEVKLLEKALDSSQMIFRIEDN